MMKQIEEMVKEDPRVMGEMKKLPVDTQNGILSIANQFLRDPDYQWMGILLYRRLGRPDPQVPNLAPEAGRRLSGPGITSPSYPSGSWVNRKPAGG
jgi:hypothetical protein